MTIHRKRKGRLCVYACCLALVLLLGVLHYRVAWRTAGEDARDTTIVDTETGAGVGVQQNRVEMVRQFKQRIHEEPRYASERAVADFPAVMERTVAQGDVLPISYPTLNQSGVLRCDDRDTRYRVHQGYIAFLVAAQYDSTGDIVCMLDDTTVARITVTEKTFEKIPLTVPKQYIAYPPETLKRIQREKAHLKEMYGQSAYVLHPKAFAAIPYMRITSPYGEQRVYQNGHISSHNGADFGLGVGAPVYAVGDGTVVLARELYFCGNTVIIDHGLDIFSVYCHLDSIAVAEGQGVRAEESIGGAGDSGLAVGPHLHLAMKVNDQWVDPYAFLRVIGMLGKKQGE